jgi:HEPN domain-containing protein/predicted nucleotidyltransferase
MLKTLKGVRDRIIKHYDPERIILFGSYGEAGFTEDSDIDLLVIKDTDKKPIERQLELEKIISDRELPLDVRVYTPEEVRFLFSIGSPFVEEIMEKGRVLYMRRATEAWVKDTEENLDSAVILLEHKKYRSACYHAQQCVEKGLKAMILEKGKRPGRTHDIVELMNQIKKLELEAGLSVDEAIFFNSIYRGRYPTEEGLLPHGEPTPEEARKAVSTARIIWEKLKGKLQ